MVGRRKCGSVRCSGGDALIAPTKHRQSRTDRWTKPSTRPTSEGVLSICTLVVLYLYTRVFFRNQKNLKERSLTRGFLYVQLSRYLQGVSNLFTDSRTRYRATWTSAPRSMAKSIYVLALLSWHLRAATTQARRESRSEPDVATDHGYNAELHAAAACVAGWLNPARRDGGAST